MRTNVQALERMKKTGTNAIARMNASALGFKRASSQKAYTKIEFSGVILEA